VSVCVCERERERERVRERELLVLIVKLVLMNSLMKSFNVPNLFNPHLLPNT